MANNTVQNKSNNANISIVASVSQYITLPYAPSSSGQQIVANLPLLPGSYSLSTSALQRAGLNIAVEQFSEPRPARKAVQQTLEGIFVDTYDVAPPMLTILYAIEMPQATNNTNLKFYTPKNTAQNSDQSQAITGQNITVSQAQSLSSIKSSTQYLNNLSFVEMLDLIYLTSSQRENPNAVTILFHDFTRRVHHQISILNVAYRASVQEQNILIVQVDAVVIRANYVTTALYNASGLANTSQALTSVSPLKSASNSL